MNQNILFRLSVIMTFSAGLILALVSLPSVAENLNHKATYNLDICQNTLDEMAQPLYRTEQQIKQYQLDNGMAVSLLSRPKSHTVSLTGHFSVGSANEQPGQTGYAHLFEHLLFKGSKNAPQDTYARKLKAIGASFNASTHFDFTNYYARFPASGTQLALFLEADRFIYPALTPLSIRNQQAAVLEEMATRIDNQPYIRKAMNFLLDQVKGTPYGHAIIGSKADIMGADLDSLNQFHQTYYQPNNVHLALVGKLPQQTTHWIDTYFGDWAKAKAEHEGNQSLKISEMAPTTPIKVQAKPVSSEIIDDRGPWPGLLLAWHTVAKTHSDAAAITLLEAHLLQNKASLLNKMSLNDPDQLLSYSLPFPMARHGMANLVLVPRARSSLNQLALNIEGLIAQISHNSLSPRNLCQLKQTWLTQRLNLLNQEQALAQFIAANHQLIDPLTAQWKQIKQVTPDDIQRVSAQYFKGNTLRLDLLPPWYIRSIKSITETLPESWSDMLERAIL